MALSQRSVAPVYDRRLPEPEADSSVMPVRRHRLGADAGFVALCALVAGVRYSLLVRLDAPTGIDPGNWLAFGHTLLGESLRSSEIVYPPLVPLVLTAAVSLLGPVHGVATVASLASLVPAVGVYLVLRSTGLAWEAMVLAALVALVSGTGEATAWGGYPQLIGIGTAVVFLWRLDAALGTRRPRQALVVGVLLAVLAATSHLLTAAAAIGAAVVLLGHLGRMRHQGAGGTRSLGIVLGLVVLPALPLVPLYVQLAASVGASVADRDEFLRLQVGDVWSQLEFVYRELKGFWRSMLLATAFIPWLLISRRRSPVWMVTTALLVSIVVTTAITREGRFLYLAPTVAVLAVGLWLWDLRQLKAPLFMWIRRGVVAVLFVALGAQAQSAHRLFIVQRDFYALPPGVLHGVEWLGENTPRDALVAVSPLIDGPLGWWVEGLARRRTLPASPLRWLNFDDEIKRARVANEIFGQRFPSREGMVLAERAGVTHVLVAKRWRDFSLTDLVEARGAGAVVFENSDCVILSVA